MNIHDEKSKEFLKLNKILRELRMLRFSYLGTENQKRVEEAMKALGPICDGLKKWLDDNNKHKGDYDL